MQFELWARSRETNAYEFLQAFYEESQFYYMLDQVDSEIYYEAMIVQTEFRQQPRCIMYIELNQEKGLHKKEEDK